MKSKLLLLAGFVLSSATVFSQGFYTGFGGGYGFGVLKSSENNYSAVYDGSSNKTTLSAVHFSYGQGLNFGVYAGYEIKKGFATELGFSYLKGAGFDTHYENKNTLFNTETGTDVHTYGKSLRLLPALRYSFGSTKMSGYVKAGILLSFGTRLIEETHDYNSFFGISTSDYTTREYTSSFCHGAYGAIGLVYMITKNLGVYAEANGFFQQWSPSKSEITRYEIDGTNELSSLTTYERETEYVKEYDEPSSINNSEPSKSTKIDFPFSSLGINIGFHFNFGKTE